MKKIVLLIAFALAALLLAGCGDGTETSVTCEQAKVLYELGGIDKKTHVEKACGGSVTTAATSDEEESSDEKSDEADAQTTTETESKDGGGEGRADGETAADSSDSGSSSSGPQTPMGVALSAWIIFLLGASGFGLSLYALFFKTKPLNKRLSEAEERSAKEQEEVWRPLWVVIGHLDKQIEDLKPSKGNSPERSQP